MSNTIIMGDIAEGQKWFGEAEFLKQRQVAIYRTTNQNMSAWKHVNTEVKIFVKMINGTPQAFIFTEGGYEFSVQNYINFERYTPATGISFYNGIETSPQKVLWNPDDIGVPLSTWYSTTGYVTNLSAARYRNVYIKTDSVPMLYSWKYHTNLYSGGVTKTYSSIINGQSSAIYGKYIWYIDPGGTNQNSVVYVEDTVLKQVVFQKFIKGSWPGDTFEDRNTAKGYYSFNRAGNKVCTVVWVSQSERFENMPESVHLKPYIGDYRTSYILELELQLDGDGNFSNIITTQQIETKEFCIAADYDWTTPENELVAATLYGYDYRIAKATLASGWDISTGVILGEVGDHFHTQYVNGTMVRPASIYKLANIYTSPLDGTLKANYENVTTEHSAMDIWLKVEVVNGPVLMAVELANNIDVKTKQSSAGTWYAKPGPSFINNISGLDLRIQGITAYSDNGAVVVTAYDQGWTNGNDIPVSGLGPKTQIGNFYVPDTLYSCIKIMTIPQTIATIPHLKTDTNEIKNLAVYAPLIINEETGEANPNSAVDFKIDIKDDKSAEGAMQLGYHRKIYELKYPDQPPYLNRYFNVGVWAKKKERT